MKIKCKICGNKMVWDGDAWICFQCDSYSSKHNFVEGNDNDLYNEDDDFLE